MVEKFKTVSKEEFKAGGKVQRKRVPRTSKQQSLDGIIATLQSLGYKVTPASSEEDKEKQEASLEKLGIKGKKKPPDQPQQTTFVCVLRCRHAINGQVYGPGHVEIDADKPTLYQHLLHQDQLATAEFYDVYRPHVQTFLVGRGSRKIPVADYQFANLDAFEPTVSAGKHDAAGYNPHFNPTGQF